jgi:hypothetical protein
LNIFVTLKVFTSLQVIVDSYHLGMIEKKKLYIWFTTNKMLLIRMCKALQLSSKRESLIHQIFPIDKEFPEEIIPQLNEHQLFDKSIYKNAEQFKAVNYILAGSSKPYPYILHGPPGTGKSVAIAEAIKQVYTMIPGSNIVVTAQSNSAVDLLAERLVQHIPSGRFASNLMNAIKTLIFVVRGLNLKGGSTL